MNDNTIIYCNNCGLKGHMQRDCRNPVLSCGNLIFRKDTEEPKVMMIQRKDSLCFIDLIRGGYGKIPGVVDLDLQRKIEDYQLHEIDHFDVDILKKDFISFCEENNLKKIKNSDTDLLNFILFPEQAKDFYLQQRKPSFNDIIELQEGFGFYLSGLSWITNSLTFDDNFKIFIPFALIFIPLFFY